MPEELEQPNLPDRADESDESDEAGEIQQITIPKQVLDSLPENVRASIVRHASFSGPLPPPAMYGEYDKVLPGSAGRLLELTENQSSHRIDWERTALKASISATTRGQWFGFIVSLVAISAAIFLATQGQSVVGGLLAIVSVLGLVDRIFDRLFGRSSG